MNLAKEYCVARKKRQRKQAGNGGIGQSTFGIVFTWLDIILICSFIFFWTFPIWFLRLSVILSARHLAAALSPRPFARPLLLISFPQEGRYQYFQKLSLLVWPNQPCLLQKCIFYDILVKSESLVFFLELSISSCFCSECRKSRDCSTPSIKAIPPAYKTNRKGNFIVQINN